MAETPTNGPTITIIRHAQGLHNIDATAGNLFKKGEPRGFNIPDPYLTSVGLMQCVEYQERENVHAASLLVASPSKRAIQTALLCYAPALKRLGRYYTTPLVREVNPTHRCNEYGTAEDLVKEFGSLMRTDMLQWWGEVTENPQELDSMLPEALVRRSFSARSWFQRQLKQNIKDSQYKIVVVTHGEFIPYLTGDFIGGMWGHCESRTYQFADGTFMDQSAALVETEESLKKRGATRRPSPQENAEEKLRWDSYQRRQHSASKAVLQTTVFE
ncbi:hypothetical protein Hte_003615 [Hypoxylon texense]